MSTLPAFAPDPELSFWPTPADVADDLVFGLLLPWHVQSRPGDVRVLEPSAGDGHLITAVRRHIPGAHVTAVEPAAERAGKLRALPGLDVVESTLEDYLTQVSAAAAAGTWEPYHLVVMNPPFTLAGRPEAWAEHVLAIYRHPDLLGPGMQIGAVVPHIVRTGKSRLVRQVRDLLHPVYGCQPCDRGAFDPTGAQVATALLWIEKPDDEHGGLW